MSASMLIGWKRPLVAALVLALVPGVSASQVDVKIGATGLPLGLGVEGQKFKLTSERYSIPKDGWLQFEYNDKTLEFDAPTPVILLNDEEWKQWRTDVVTFQFEKLRDRRLLYVYYLWPPDAKDEEAVVISKAVLDAVGEIGDLSVALGVEYDIENDTRSKELPIAANLYHRAAVPVRWNQASSEFIKEEYAPTTIAELVKATATTLPMGAYANIWAVENWSALAKNVGLETEVVRPKSLSPSAGAAYKGPFIWPDLTPIASFIAVDRKLDLDLEGFEAKPILTSKRAWSAILD